MKSAFLFVSKPIIKTNNCNKNVITKKLKYISNFIDIYFYKVYNNLKYETYFNYERRNKYGFKQTKSRTKS